MNAPTIKQPATPTAMDAALIAANLKLKRAAPWLTNLYGKSQTLSRLNDKKRLIKYPAIYTGTGAEYASLLPDEALGNYSWWDVGDYQIENVDRQAQVINAPFGLIIFVNISKTLSADQLRNTEMIKQDVLDYFARLAVVGSRFVCTGVTEDFTKVYAGYSTRETDKQYMAHPYAAFRFSGTLRIEKYC